VLRAAELILHTGDFTAASVLDELLELAPVQAVRGNVDDTELRARLPERIVVEHSYLAVGLVHDAGPQAGRPERLRRAFPECQLVVYGHTHSPEVTRHEDVWIVNPGSPTERRRSPHHTMAVIEEGVPRLLEL
jgi:putative phosphoesterase